MFLRYSLSRVTSSKPLNLSHIRTMATQSGAGKRVIFTGGSGKAGRHCIPELTKRGYKVAYYPSGYLHPAYAVPGPQPRPNRLSRSQRWRLHAQDGPHRLRPGLQCSDDSLWYLHLPKPYFPHLYQANPPQTSPATNKATPSHPPTP